MTCYYSLTISILCLCLGASLIESQTGSLFPFSGQFQSLNDDTMYRMISERECVSICIRDRTTPCSGVSYESYRQECRIVRQVIPFHGGWSINR